MSITFNSIFHNKHMLGSFSNLFEQWDIPISNNNKKKIPLLQKVNVFLFILYTLSTSNMIIFLYCNHYSVMSFETKSGR